MYRDIPDDLRELIEPIIEDHGLELVDTELQRNVRPGLLRITVDQPSGSGLVNIDACALVSREIEFHLDANGWMERGGVSSEEGYRFEVTSPGLDRTLAREKDFELAVGHEIRISTRRPVGERRRFRGKLLKFGAAGADTTNQANQANQAKDTETQTQIRVATIDVDGALHEVPFSEIERANRIYEFTSADFGSTQAADADGPKPAKSKKSKKTKRVKKVKKPKASKAEAGTSKKTRPKRAKRPEIGD